MASDETTKESTEKIFLTPNLPCYDSVKWERVQEAYSTESLTKNFKSKTKLNQAERMEILTRIMSYGSSMVKPKLGGLQSMFQNPSLPNYYSADNFFGLLLPAIARWALELPKHIDAAAKAGIELRFLLASQPQTQALCLTRALCRSLLANMFLCTITKPFWATSRYNTWNMRALLANSSAHEVAKLRMIINYFERNRLLTTPLKGEIRIFRQRITTEASEWVKSTKPLLPIHVIPDMVGFEHPKYGHNCLHADFANKYIGGGTLQGGCVQEEIRFSICPELIVSQLLCEVMTHEEAIQVIGAEQFSAYKGYMFRLRYDGDFKDTSAREEDGTVLNGISAIDALDGRSIPYFRRLSTQLDLQCMLRELNKALAGFKPAHPSIAKGFPILATGNWGCGVFGGNADLKALLQWMAASEGCISMRYFPFDEKNLGNRLKTLSQIFDSKKITVGTLWSVLQTLSSDIRNNSQKTLPDRLAQVIQSREAFMQYIQEGVLAKQSAPVLPAASPSPTAEAEAAGAGPDDAATASE